MSLHNENMSFKNETFMRFLNSIETHEEKSFDAGFKQTAQACFQRTMGSASIAYKQAVAFLSRYQQPPGDNELDIRLWNARKKIMDNVAQHRNEIEKYQKSRLVTSDRDTASLVLFHIVLFDYTKQHVAEAALVCAWHFFRVLQNGVLRQWNKDSKGYEFCLRFATMELADHSRISELSAGACAYLIALGLGIRRFEDFWDIGIRYAFILLSAKNNVPIARSIDQPQPDGVAQRSQEPLSADSRMSTSN